MDKGEGTDGSPGVEEKERDQGDPEPPGGDGAGAAGKWAESLNERLDFQPPVLP